MTPQENNALELPTADEVSLQQTFEDREKRPFPELLITLAKHKYLIVFFPLGVAIVSAIISLFLTKIYTATAKMLPPQQGQSFAASMLGQLGPLAPLLTGGAGLGIRNPNDMYVAMLRSRTVADNLINRFELMKVYRQTFRTDAQKRLENATEITASPKDNVISISVQDPDPQRAAAIANGFMEELEKLTKTLAVTDAAKRRVFFEHEASNANDELAKAEQELKQTEEKTGVIELGSQSRVMLEAYAELRAQVTAKEVEIQAMRSFATPDNPDLIRVQQELAALKTQVAHYEAGQGGRPIGEIALEKVPERALEYLRKFREVKYREALLELMLKQYEVARIDESKDSSIVQVLDKALPPERRSWPPRTALVLTSTLLALLVAIGGAFLLESLQRAREDPQFMARYHLFKFYLGPRSKS